MFKGFWISCQVYESWVIPVPRGKNGYQIPIYSHKSSLWLNNYQELGVDGFSRDFKGFLLHLNDCLGLPCLSCAISWIMWITHKHQSEVTTQIIGRRFLTFKVIILMMYISSVFCYGVDQTNPNPNPNPPCHDCVSNGQEERTWLCKKLSW